MSNPPRPKQPAASIEYFTSASQAAGLFVRPSLHRLMLEDFYRTLSLRNAMMLQVRPGMHVLEIGTGTGILAWFALEAGAARVTTIESTAFAEIARQIVTQNGLSDRITVVRGLSHEVELPEKADMLITETLGHIGYEEGILHTAWDARKRLLKPRAPIMPSTITLQAALVRGNSYSYIREFWNKDQFGLNMDAVGEQVKRMAYLTRFRDPEILAPPVPFYTCMVGDAPNFPLAGECKMTVQQDGRAHGLELSFVTQLSELSLDSRSATSWQQVFMPFMKPIDVRAGEELKMTLGLEAPGEAGIVRGGGTGHVVGDAVRSVVVDVVGGLQL